MNSGVVGAVALLAVGGALYLGSTYLGDYFDQPDAAVQQGTSGEAEEGTEPLALVPDDTETALEETVDAVTEAIEGAADAVAETVEDAVDAITDTEEASSQAVTEDATEEIAALSDDAAEEVLQSLGNDVPEEASEPGTTPVLDVVRVEPSGDVLIAGNAPEGERVGLIYNDEVVAEAEVTEGGDFVLVPDEALPTGEGTLEVVVIDENGNRESQSDEQVAIVLPEEGNEAGFLVGVLRPGQPVEIIEREAPETEVAAAEPATDAVTEAAETEEASEIETAARAEPDASTDAEASATPFVVVDAIELEGQEIWIAGAAEPGTIIRLYQNNELLGETIAGEEGRYLFEGALNDATGEVTVRADALAPGSADVIARAEVPFDMPSTVAAEVEMADADMADAATEAADSVTETANATADSVAEAAADVAESAAEAATTVTEAASETAAAAVESTQEAAADVAEQIGGVADSATSTDTADATAATQTAETEVATAPAASTERVAVLDTGRVIIRRGDNLWRLSRRVFGQGIRYTSIYDANRDQIRDPALIFPGQVFDLPTPQEEWGAVPGLEALEPDQIPGPDAAQN